MSRCPQADHVWLGADTGTAGCNAAGFRSREERGHRGCQPDSGEVLEAGGSEGIWSLRRLMRRLPHHWTPVRPLLLLPVVLPTLKKHGDTQGVRCALKT